MIIYIRLPVTQYWFEYLVLYDTIRKLGRVTGDELKIMNKGNLIIGGSAINMGREPVGVNFKDQLGREAQYLFCEHNFQLESQTHNERLPLPN